MKLNKRKLIKHLLFLALFIGHFVYVGVNFGEEAVGYVIVFHVTSVFVFLMYKLNEDAIKDFIKNTYYDETDI